MLVGNANHGYSNQCTKEHATVEEDIRQNSRRATSYFACYALFSKPATFAMSLSKVCYVATNISVGYVICTFQRTPHQVSFIQQLNLLQA